MADGGAHTSCEPSIYQIPQWFNRILSSPDTALSISQPGYKEPVWLHIIFIAGDEPAANTVRNNRR